MGQELQMVKYYFCRPKGQTSVQPCATSRPELLGRMKTFAQAQKETRPQMVMFYPDARGTIEREQWVAAPQNRWTFEQADQIRNAIMGGQSAAGVVPSGIEDVLYYYADGTRIFYSISHGSVFSVIAIAKSYKPSERSKDLPLPYEYDPKTFIKPKT